MGLEKSTPGLFFFVLRIPLVTWPISASSMKIQVRRSQEAEPELQTFLTTDGVGLETRSWPFLTLKGRLPEGGSDFRKELGRYLWNSI